MSNILITLIVSIIASIIASTIPKNIWHVIAHFLWTNPVTLCCRILFFSSIYHFKQNLKDIFLNYFSRYYLVRFRQIFFHYLVRSGRILLIAIVFVIFCIGIVKAFEIGKIVYPTIKYQFEIIFSPNCILHGKVASYKSKQCKNVDVNIFGTGEGSVGWATVTNDQGEFNLTVLRQQGYKGVLYRIDGDLVYASEFINFSNKNVTAAMNFQLPSKAIKLYKPEPIYFENDSCCLNDAAKKKLKIAAEFLKDNIEYYLILQGHCSKVGDEEYNQVLGGKRAMSARDYLVYLGVDPDRLRSVSYGEKKPNEEDEIIDQNKNRRVEFIALKI